MPEDDGERAGPSPVVDTSWYERGVPAPYPGTPDEE